MGGYFAKSLKNIPIMPYANSAALLVHRGPPMAGYAETTVQNEQFSFLFQGSSGLAKGAGSVAGFNDNCGFRQGGHGGITFREESWLHFEAHSFIGTDRNLTDQQ